MAGFFNLEAAWRALFAGKGGVPSTAGDGIDYAFPNNRSLLWDNAAGTATIAGITVNANDQVELGPRDSGTAAITGTGATGTATLSKKTGILTSAALTTAAAGTHTVTLTNTKITAASVVVCNARRAAGVGAATTGIPYVTKVIPGAGTVDIEITNIHASAPLNGTIEIPFEVVS